MTQPPVEGADRRELSRELWRLKESVHGASQAQFWCATWWAGIGTSLNVLTALLAGFAGVSTLSETVGRVPAGVLSLAAAAFAAVGTALGAEKRATAASSAGNAYIAVRDELRQARRLDLPSTPASDMREHIRVFTRRIHEINKSAPVPSRLAWWASRRRRARLEGEPQTDVVPSA
jgi:hypothetical protein